MAPIANTTTGQLQGRERAGTLLFAGIPYAAPPVGDRRFRPPAPPEPWTGVRDATAFGPQAWQGNQMLGGMFSQEAPDNNEDCLSLNVMTPACDDALRPVLFWIHGGGFEGGTGATPWYDGTAFVTRHDVVVVTINYRLGALGFLHLAELGGEAYASSGLNGILDQVAALRWVRDNIAGFGGDPDNVTIFGESAGGMSVATLLGLPSARGLFHKAIAQSGAAQFLLHPADAAARTARFCEALGSTDIDALLAAEPAALLRAQAGLNAAMMAEALQPGSHGARAGLGLPFQPVLDGVELPEPPLDAVQNGSAAQVPLLTGTTLDEWNLFGLMAGGDIDPDKAVRRIDRMTDGRGADVYDVYASARPGAAPSEVLNAVITDIVFRVPAIRLAEAHGEAAHPTAATRMYLFTHASTAFDGKLGSCHALEIPFVFDSIRRRGVDFFLGHEPPADLAADMNAAWAAFARTGDPSHAGTPGWDAYEPTTRVTMEFGDERRTLADPMGAERACWDGLL